MRDLVDFAETLDLDDDDVLGAVVRFATSVMINVGGDDLLARVDNLNGGARRAPSETEKAALEFSAAPSYAGAGNLLAAISRDAGVRTHRPPVLRGCHRLLQLCAVEGGPTPYEAAVQVREQARMTGRPLAKRTVGSTLRSEGARSGRGCDPESRADGPAAPLCRDDPRCPQTSELCGAPSTLNPETLIPDPAGVRPVSRATANISNWSDRRLRRRCRL